MENSQRYWPRQWFHRISIVQENYNKSCKYDQIKLNSFQQKKNLQSEKATYRIQEMCYYSSDTGLKYKMHRELKK